MSVSTPKPATALRVLIVGAGGLGCPAAWALATAGAGTIGIADPDRVDVSNLHRQVLHRTSGVGRLKVDSVRERLARRGLRVETYAERLDAEGLARLLPRYDVAIDGTDDPAAKLAINDAALATGVPYVHGGVVGLEGRAMTVVPGRTPCLRCVFPAPEGGAEDDGDAPTCSRDGVLGSVAGAIGAVQAAEALAVGRAGTSPLAGRLLILHALRGFRTVGLRRDPECAGCGSDLRAGGAERFGVRGRGALEAADGL